MCYNITVINFWNKKYSPSFPEIDSGKCLVVVKLDLLICEWSPAITYQMIAFEHIKGHVLSIGFHIFHRLLLEEFLMQFDTL